MHIFWMGMDMTMRRAFILLFNIMELINFLFYCFFVRWKKSWEKFMNEITWIEWQWQNTIKYHFNSCIEMNIKWHKCTWMCTEYEIRVMTRTLRQQFRIKWIGSSMGWLSVWYGDSIVRLLEKLLLLIFMHFDGKEEEKTTISFLS